MNIRTVPTLATRTLDHRAFHGQAWRGGFVLASADGEASVVDRDLGVVRRVDLAAPTADITLDADGTWAWIAGGQLRIGDPDDSGTVMSGVPDQAACRWRPNGEALWTALGTGTEVRVEVHDRDRRTVRRATVPDPFGDSGLSLEGHPRDDSVVLWLGAGQDGQEAWLLSDDGETIRTRRLPVRDCLPPRFAPGGDWFVTADDDRLLRLSWPDGAIRGTLAWEALARPGDAHGDADDDADDEPGFDLWLRPGGHASWSSMNGRIHIVDVTTMSAVDEIAIEGHPIQPVSALYPRLAGDDAPCTDFAFSLPGPGGTVLSVHGQTVIALSAARSWSPPSGRTARPAT